MYIHVVNNVQSRSGINGTQLTWQACGPQDTTTTSDACCFSFSRTAYWGKPFNYMCILSPKKTATHHCSLFKITTPQDPVKVPMTYKIYIFKLGMLPSHFLGCSHGDLSPVDQSRDCHVTVLEKGEGQMILLFTYLEAYISPLALLPLPEQSHQRGSWSA